MDTEEFVAQIARDCLEIAKGSLTPRQFQVAELVIKGKSQSEIARELGIIQPTVHQTIHGVKAYGKYDKKHGGIVNKFRKLLGRNGQLAERRREFADMCGVGLDDASIAGAVRDLTPAARKIAVMLGFGEHGGVFGRYGAKPGGKARGSRNITVDRFSGKSRKHKREVEQLFARRVAARVGGLGATVALVGPAVPEHVEDWGGISMSGGWPYIAAERSGAACTLMAPGIVKAGGREVSDPVPEGVPQLVRGDIFSVVGRLSKSGVPLAFVDFDACRTGMAMFRDENLAGNLTALAANPMLTDPFALVVTFCRHGDPDITPHEERIRDIFSRFGLRVLESWCREYRDGDQMATILFVFTRDGKTEMPLPSLRKPSKPLLQEGVYRCGECGEVGHNRRTCSVKSRERV